MRYRRRIPLPEKAVTFLAGHQSFIAENSGCNLTERWNLARRHDMFREIEATLREMNAEQSYCMYCECSEARHIDHFRPKAKYPEYAFEWSNYFLSCETCNSKAKGSKFPLAEDGTTPLLLKPDEDQPLNHLELDGITGRLEARPGSLKAAPSIEVFALNRQHLTQGRKDAWKAIERLLKDYAASEDESCRSSLMDELRHHPFQAVFEEQLLLYRQGHYAALEQTTVAALTRYPELGDWVTFPLLDER